jgi:acetyltransferase-like isoleucine patch superfamily enzyme
MTAVLVVVPRLGAGEDEVSLRRWLVAPGQAVVKGQELAEIDTSKATNVVESPRSGYLFQRAKEDDIVKVGDVLAEIHSEPVEQAQAGHSQVGAPDISRKAQVLMDKHGLNREDFPGLSVIRVQDVERNLGRAKSEIEQPESVIPGRDTFQEMTHQMRLTMRTKFDRHVPTGTLLHDRWKLAAELGFGEGSSIYDESLVLGQVEVGRHCWIGPFTVLDGAHARLTIGDYTDIAAGAQIYTHNNLERVLTGHRAPSAIAAVEIGRCCFIAPHVVIGPGSVVGDHSFVASGSYVEGRFPSHSYLAGTPAVRVGEIEIVDGRARLRRFEDQE